MFTPEFIQQVSTTAIVVIGVVEVLKKVLKFSGIVSYIVSLIVSVVTCFPVLSTGGLESYVVFVVCVTLAANGVFKALKTSTA